MNDTDIIDYLLTRDTMGSDAICQKIADMVNEKNRQKHKAKVWQGSNGYWYTYIPDNGMKSGRRLIKKRNKCDIDKVLAFYHGDVKPSNSQKVLRYTFEQAYEAWKKRQKMFGLTQQTFELYASRYKRFFENDPIVKMDMTDIDEQYIESFMSRTIDRTNPSKSEFAHLISTLKSIFRVAYMERRTNNNVCDRVDFQLFFRRLSDSSVASEDRIWTVDECKHLIDFLKEHRQKYPERISDYVLIVALYTGMRAGELAFLQWKNIHEDYIYVCGSQKHINGQGIYYDGPTKTKKTRKIPMTPELKSLFDDMYKTEEKYGYLTDYVFSDKRGRINLACLEQNANCYCRQAGLKNSGLQVARRTFNSILKNSGMSTSVASSLLGHTTAVNETYYTYDTSNMDYKESMMEKVTRLITE